MRFPFAIDSRTEEMNNLRRTEYRINVLDSVQMVICLANLAIPFSWQFLQRETKELVCFVKGNLVGKDSLCIAILVQLIPFVKEFLGLGRVASKDNTAIEKHLRKRKLKTKEALIPVIALMLDMIGVVFMGMQIRNAADIAGVIDNDIQLVDEGGITVKIKEVPLEQVSHVRL